MKGWRMRRQWVVFNLHVTTPAAHLKETINPLPRAWWLFMIGPRDVDQEESEEPTEGGKEKQAHGQTASQAKSNP